MTKRVITRSNERLFRRVTQALTARATRDTPGSIEKKAIRHETHVPALQGPPRATARLPRPHADGGRPQGSLVAPRKGPRASFRLTPGASAVTSRRLRLRGARAFERVLRSGRRLPGVFLDIIFAPALTEVGRIGYVIGRRSIPLAVDRNRLRRGLREAWRLLRERLAPYDIVIRIKRPVARDELNAAVLEGAQALRRLAAGVDA